MILPGAEASGPDKQKSFQLDYCIQENGPS